MKENIKILVLPDVHGREFWKNSVQETLKNKDSKIIFLGDYLDPYNIENISKEKAIEVFEEIIALKKQYPKQITLLLGNHDCTYAISTDICYCRTDNINFSKIQKLFVDNKDLFQLADEETIDGKHIIFSHAGISKNYADYVFKNNYTNDNIVKLFNDGYHNNDVQIINSLSLYDSYRGYGGMDFASLVWADVREWENENISFIDYQVFGHTQLVTNPYCINKGICVDVRRAFYINDKAEIFSYEDDKKEFVF